MPENDTRTNTHDPRTNTHDPRTNAHDPRTATATDTDANTNDAAAVAPAGSRARPTILIDCDPGHDDVMAIGLAAQYCDIVGITSVGGNSTLANTTRNALIAADLFELHHVPVHAGAGTPLSTIVQPHPTEAHGSSGLDGPVLPTPSRGVTSDDAVGFIIQQARAVDDLWIVALGPLTNVALALRQAPDIVDRLAGISLMGGSLTAGNSTAAAEFNIWFDADAAAEVYDTAARSPQLHIRMCGLDLTAQVGVDASFVDALAEPNTTATNFCFELMTFYRKTSLRFARVDAVVEPARAAALRAPLFDPCAVLAVTHPELFAMRRRHVVVETRGQYTRGMTLADLRPWADPSNANVTVVETADPSCVAVILDAITKPVRRRS